MSTSRPEPVHDRLRRQRTEVLQRGLRETAALLGVTPTHLSDLERGKREPSEALLVRVAEVYRLPVANLRAGWGRADAIVQEVATQDPLTAEKAPDLLRSARSLTSEQWDELTRIAREMATRKGGAARRSATPRKT